MLLEQTQLQLNLYRGGMMPYLEIDGLYPSKLAG